MDAFPPGDGERRSWLTRIWDSATPLALVVGINPSSASDTTDDDMTRFLIRHLRSLTGEYSCGGFALVNCCDLRDSKPSNLVDAHSPCSSENLTIVEEWLSKCDFVVASWGTTDYGRTVSVLRDSIAKLVKASDKSVICFSPLGRPIYCSETNKNSRPRKGDNARRWSDVPVFWKSV